jgi:crotonobetainyl-CoA:carnitine CoA-transferase CaiB-like acyl-CoA transferase
MRPPDLLADPHLDQRQSWDLLDRQGGVPWISFGTPFRFHHAGRGTPMAAPSLGAHSREVLAELLGMTDAEYDEHVSDGVIA